MYISLREFIRTSIKCLFKRIQMTFFLFTGRAWRRFMGRSGHRPEIQEKSRGTWESRKKCQRLWPNSSARWLCKWHDCLVWLAEWKDARQSVFSNRGEAVCERFHGAFKHSELREKSFYMKSGIFIASIFLHISHLKKTVIIYWKNVINEMII